ncbi:MAG: hypothetical protein ABJB11_07250 [Ferruginibacter sp.]
MIVTFIFIVVLIYLVCGLIFTGPFLIKGIKKIDAGTHGSTWGFKLIIIPGIIVLWPALLQKWRLAVKGEMKAIHK